MATSGFSTGDKLCLIVGNPGTPGAPILHLSLLFDEAESTLSGKGEITQALPPPDGQIKITYVTGIAHLLVWGSQPTFSIALKGAFFTNPLTPLTQQFEATFITDTTWNGQGSFSYGGKTVSNVPVKQLELISGTRV